jgi:chemotaxis methyl-accepting protein methylase
VAERSKIGLKKLRIWSAGCSTGEEPYTLAMFLQEEKAKLLKDWSFEIQATDLNDRSIETARAGIYGDYALRNTTDAFKRKYFSPTDGSKLRVRDEVRAHITFSRLNLNDDQLNLSQQENGLAGADMAAVATNFAQAQIASQATVNATARVLSLPTLLSYLK